MKKIHWTQTPEGRARMSNISKLMHKEGKGAFSKKAQRKAQKSKAEIIVVKAVKKINKPVKPTPIDVNLFMEIINKLLR